MRLASEIGNTALAFASAAAGIAHGLVGSRFDFFGRCLDLRLLLRGAPGAVSYIQTPVSCVRYWEFDFADRAVPRSAHRALDVASPRLFSFFALSRMPQLNVLMINPDGEDAGLTKSIAETLRLDRIAVKQLRVDEIRLGTGHVPDDALFDVVWCISVLEHISGQYDEQPALQWLWERLAPGGRLILTVPFDRESWTEYRDRDPYGLSPREPAKNGKHFFQRWYDAESLRKRIIAAVGVRPSLEEYYGERTAGHFHEYTRRFLKQGKSVAIHDPAMMARHYRVWPCAQEMPGAGIAGLAFDKPY